VWLECFGTILGTVDYKSVDGLPNLKEDNIEVLMRLNKHIPLTLPAFGKKLYSQYRGQPILCSSCFELGHLRKECSNPRRYWAEYVRAIFATKQYPSELFGSWREILHLNQQKNNT